jgi:hypothetical protein
MAPVIDISMEAERVMDMAMAADQGIPGVRGVGDKPGYETTATLSARCVVFLTK